MVDEDDEGVNPEEDADLYTQEGMEEAEESDVIDEVEEGFMMGYEEGEKMAKCGNCGKVLKEDIVEREINDEIYRFCSIRCADKFEEKRIEE